MKSAPSIRSVFNSLPPLPPDNWYLRFQAWCERYKIGECVERKYPFVIGALSGLATAWISLSTDSVNNVIKGVLPTALSVVSIFAGFQAISISIMIGTATSEVAKRLSKWGELTRIADYLKASILTVALFTVVGIGILTINYISFPMPWHSRLESGLLVSGFIWATLDSVRLALLMVKLFRYHLEHLSE